MKLTIHIEQPEARPPELTAEDRVEELMEECECSDDPRPWETLRNLFNRLANAKTLSNRQRRMLEKIEPFMLKYGYDEPRGVDVQATYPSERKD